MTSIKVALLFFVTVCNFSCNENHETVQDLVDNGVDLVNQKKFEEGIALYTKAIKKNSKVQLAYYNRGIAYSEIKEYTKALADIDKVLQLKNKPVLMINRDFSRSAEGQGQIDFGDIFYQRAVVKLYMDSLQSSFNDFQNAIANGYSDSSNCLVLQGVLLGRAGKHEKACEYFEKAKKAAQTIPQQKEAIDMINKYCSGTKKIR